MSGQIKEYSIGYCLVNKEPNTDIIRAVPTDVFPMVDGELVDHAEKYNASGRDSFGGGYSEEMETTIGIKCKWLCQDANALTSPDVRRGAKVRIYRMGNSDQFYWTLYTNTDNHQKLETVIRGYSNTQDENAVADEANTWIQGVDTRDNKEIIFGKTTKSDGEAYAYDTRIDAKNSRIFFKDDDGNEILLDSKNAIIRLQNSYGTFIELNKDKINMSCVDYTNNSSSSMTENSTNKSGNYSGGQTTTTPNHSHVGNLGISGGLSSGPGANGADFTFTGNINQIGSITSTGDHKAGGISLMTHTHIDSIGGSTSVPK